MLRVCVKIPRPCAGADTPPGSAGRGGSGTPESYTGGKDAERAYSLQLPRPSHYWWLKFQAIQTLFQSPSSLLTWMKPESQKAPLGKAVKVWAFWGVSFHFAVYWLVRKLLGGFCIHHCGASPSLWFLQTAVLLPGKLQGPSCSEPRPGPPQGLRLGLAGRQGVLPL